MCDDLGQTLIHDSLPDSVFLIAIIEQIRKILGSELQYKWDTGHVRIRAFWHHLFADRPSHVQTILEQQVRSLVFGAGPGSLT